MKNFSSERSVQILVALLKAHGIRKAVVSPGTTNISFVASMQCDPWFELYSSIDERSAAYIACGLAAQSGEPVVLSCTGATASRNYMSGLTEAFYRKLPILAVTASQKSSQIGHMFEQMTDRRQLPRDIARLSVELPIVESNADAWECETKTNQALLELKRHGGGPVHINLQASFSWDFSVKQLPQVRAIRRFRFCDELPKVPSGSIAVWIGSHKKWTEEESAALDAFCSAFNGVALCSHTSGYHGEFRVLYNLISAQANFQDEPFDLVIHIGELTGHFGEPRAKQVWRVSEDGELRDRFKKLTCVFEMPETFFFRRCLEQAKREAEEAPGNATLPRLRSLSKALAASIPELPFSNMWIASQTAPLIPENSIMHFGINHSLRCWNYFELPKSVETAANVGGYGIDGCISSLIGASLAAPDRLCFLALGDLAFFYDMNSLGNRHIAKNLRILLVNNGRGLEFYNSINPGSLFGSETDCYIGAAGHYGRQSPELVRHYAQDLGFEYLTASSKDEFKSVVGRFVSPEKLDKPILLEAFVEEKAETASFEIMRNLKSNIKGEVLSLAKKALPGKLRPFVKNMLGK